MHPRDRDLIVSGAGGSPNSNPDRHLPRPEVHRCSAQSSDSRTAMERSNIAPVLEEKARLVQLTFFDWIEPDPVHDTQPSNHATAAEAVAPAQQPAADPAIAPVHEAQTPAITPVGGVDGAFADGKSSDDSATEPGEQDTAGTEPDPIPPGGFIPVTTGREAMTSRAVRLHNRIANQLEIKPMELRTEGDPILVDSRLVRELRSAYMTLDARYQEDLKDTSTRESAVARREHRRAWDRARQEINRAFDDLVTVYAADEVADPPPGKRTGYLVYRLPEVLRRQLNHRADSVVARPNRGRILVDRAGFDVGRQPPIGTPTLQQQEWLDQETDG